MKMRMAVLALTLACANQAMAWGERGHHLICEVATRLVQNKNLKNFLVSKGHQMGHVCNIPDIYWRDLPNAKAGDAAHFLNPENLGYRAETVPTDFSQVVSAAGKPAAHVAEELGTVWWRADQFFRLAVDGGKLAKSSPFPDKAHEQDMKHPFNRGVHSLIVSLGLMGHFVGDASQPYHNSADYDGYGTGHGGIHSYYESSCINAMGMELAKEIETAALSQRDLKVDQGTVLERMKALSTLAANELKLVENADVTLAPSQTSPGKIPAKRASAEQGAKRFHDLIVPQLARSAALLARYWDEAFVAAGEPDLFKYRSYAYPLTPDFVGLDYVH